MDAGTEVLVREEMVSRIPSMLAEWLTMAEQTPWIELPPEHRIDHLPALVEACIRLALQQPDEPVDRRAELIENSISHGGHRRAQGAGIDLVLAESGLLRNVVWTYLADVVDDVDARISIILRIDSVLTLATNVSMVAYGSAKPNEPDHITDETRARVRTHFARSADR